MGLIIIRLLPVLLPLIYYMWWLRRERAQALEAGEPVPQFGAGPMYKTLIAMLVIALVSFLLIPIGKSNVKGDYTPPSFKDGKIVPGKVTPKTP